MGKPVGLLYDHVNANFGDGAIGVTLEQTVRSAGLRYETIDFEKPLDQDRYSTVIVGGGHLIRRRGDPFYDNFLLPGKHILNAVGISQDADDLSFLKDYTYVCVRSYLDLHKIKQMRPDAVVSPCLSLLLDIGNAASFLPRIYNAIAIAVHPGCKDELEGWPEKVREAFPDMEIILFSYVIYIEDYLYLEKIARSMGCRFLCGLSPQSLAAFIFHPGVKAVFSTSLHISMFAYRSLKPFLVYPCETKITAFLEDRGLGVSQWSGRFSPKDLRDHVDQQRSTMNRTRSLVEEDLRTVTRHKARLVEICSERC